MGISFYDRKVEYRFTTLRKLINKMLHILIIPVILCRLRIIQFNRQLVEAYPFFQEKQTLINGDLLDQE